MKSYVDSGSFVQLCYLKSFINENSYTYAFEIETLHLGTVTGSLLLNTLGGSSVINLSKPIYHDAGKKTTNAPRYQ